MGLLSLGRSGIRAQGSQRQRAVGRPRGPFDSGLKGGRGKREKTCTVSLPFVKGHDWRTER